MKRKNVSVGIDSFLLFFIFFFLVQLNDEDILLFHIFICGNYYTIYTQRTSLVVRPPRLSLIHPN